MDNPTISVAGTFYLYSNRMDKVTYRFKDKFFGLIYHNVEQIIPIQDIGDYQNRLTVKKQEETISSEEEATRYKTRYNFWEKALPILRIKIGVFNNVSPTKDNWLLGASGHSGVSFSPVIKFTFCSLVLDYIMKNSNIDLFPRLKNNKLH